MWIVYSLGAAFFAGLTAVLAKAGVESIPSSLATAVRTIIVLVCAGVMVQLVGSAPTITELDAKTWVFLVLSGIATGASWLFFFRALQLGPVAKVAVVDKSSIVLTLILAIVVFGETESLAVKLVGIVLIAVGTYLMLERPARSDTGAEQGPWMLYASGAAVFAALTAVLGKVGISGVEANLGVFIRTTVVIVMAWLVVLAKDEYVSLRNVPKRELVFLGLSGVATGASWLFYWKAMQDGPASVVVPIDKLSVVVTVGLAAIFFRERQGRRSLLGLGLIVGGTLAMVATA